MLPISNKHTAFWALGGSIRKELNGEPSREYAEYCRDHGVGLYFTVNELGDDRNEHGNLRDAKNVTGFNALFADFDHGEKVHQLELLSNLSMPATAIVESGRGYHAYWEISQEDRYTISPEDWKHAQRTVASALGSDSACSDPARLMRLPGSYHVKPDFEPSIVQIRLQTSTSYRWDEILSGFNIPKKKVFVLSTHGRGYRSALRPPSLRLSEGERHAALIKYGARMFMGVAPSEVEDRRATLKAWYVDSCIKLKDDWEREVDSYIDGWLIKKELGA